jgi:hypothetical protein
VNALRGLICATARDGMSRGCVFLVRQDSF